MKRGWDWVSTTRIIRTGHFQVAPVVRRWMPRVTLLILMNISEFFLLVYQYDQSYLAHQGSKPICFAMPKRGDVYYSQHLFPFFHGLLAEGVTSEIQCRKLKIDESDYFGRLLKTGGDDIIGSITVEEVVE